MITLNQLPSWLKAHLNRVLPEPASERASLREVLFHYPENKNAFNLLVELLAKKQDLPKVFGLYLKFCGDSDVLLSGLHTLLCSTYKG